MGESKRKRYFQRMREVLQGLNEGRSPHEVCVDWENVKADEFGEVPFFSPGDVVSEISSGDKWRVLERIGPSDLVRLESLSDLSIKFGLGSQYRLVSTLMPSPVSS